VGLHAKRSGGTCEQGDGPSCTVTDGEISWLFERQYFVSVSAVLRG
jgi:hypothetical protein